MLILNHSFLDSIRPKPGLQSFGASSDESRTFSNAPMMNCESQCTNDAVQESQQARLPVACDQPKLVRDTVSHF
jgi:hypothetical protein